MTDALGVVRAWIRAQELVPADNVVFSVPEMNQPPLPLIVISRQGGATTYWLDSPRFTFECWGENKNLASDIATNLAKSVANIDNMPMFEHETWVITGAQIDQVAERPGVSWAKRFHVDAQFHIRM